MPSVICTICGGSLCMDADGIFRCETCGCRYTVGAVHGILSGNSPQVQAVEAGDEIDSALRIAREAVSVNEHNIASDTLLEAIKSHPADYSLRLELLKVKIDECLPSKIIANPPTDAIWRLSPTHFHGSFNDCLDGAQRVCPSSERDTLEQLLVQFGDACIRAVHEGWAALYSDDWRIGMEGYPFFGPLKSESERIKMHIEELGIVNTSSGYESGSQNDNGRWVYRQNSDGGGSVRWASGRVLEINPPSYYDPFTITLDTPASDSDEFYDLLVREANDNWNKAIDENRCPKCEGLLRTPWLSSDLRCTSCKAYIYKR